MKRVAKKNPKEL